MRRIKRIIHRNILAWQEGPNWDYGILDYPRWVITVVIIVVIPVGVWNGLAHFDDTVNRKCDQYRSLAKEGNELAQVKMIEKECKP